MAGIYFNILYRSPACNHTSAEFLKFLVDSKNSHLKIKAENPFAIFFVGDFKGKCQYWWPDVEASIEGRVIEEMLSSPGLSQIISEPTNLETGKKPPCIDLVATDQPNIILDSGTRDSLDSFCHHQIIN